MAFTFQQEVPFVKEIDSIVIWMMNYHGFCYGGFNWTSGDSLFQVEVNGFQESFMNKYKIIKSDDSIYLMISTYL